MPDPVRIRYDMIDGREAEVVLEPQGHREAWSLVLRIYDSGVKTVDHAHAIDGTPEVEVG